MEQLGKLQDKALLPPEKELIIRLGDSRAGLESLKKRCMYCLCWNWSKDSAGLSFDI